MLNKSPNFSDLEYVQGVPVIVNERTRNLIEVPSPYKTDREALAFRVWVVQVLAVFGKYFDLQMGSYFSVAHAFDLFGFFLHNSGITIGSL